MRSSAFVGADEPPEPPPDPVEAEPDEPAEPAWPEFPPLPAAPPPGTAPKPVPKPRIAPQRLMKLLSEAIPPEAVVALDTGDHTLWWGRCFENRGQRVLLSGRWRTLGFALPAAIAASLACPGRPVVAVAGDGGAQQTLLELKTASKLGLPIVMIIVNNGAYAIERNRMLSAGLEPLGAYLDNPDFAALAKALGAEGVRAGDEDAFCCALEEAFKIDRPAKPFLIDAAVSPDPVPHTTL